MDVELGCALEVGFIFRRMNAIDRAGFDAMFVFSAGVNDNVCHEKGLRPVPVHVWGQTSAAPNCLKHQESFYSNRAEVGEMPQLDDPEMGQAGIADKFLPAASRRHPPALYDVLSVRGWAGFSIARPAR
jgi:hypothetical protein